MSLDEWLGKVIEDKSLFRKPLNEFNRDWQVAWVDQNVVGKMELRERRDPSQKIRPKKKLIIGLSLDNMTNAHKLWILGKLGELIANILRAKINPADDAGDKRALAGEFQEPASLFQRLPRLDRNASVETRGIQLGL